jgi:exosome complex protein LRP1
MEPQTDLPELVEDLEVNIDELSAALEPLLATPVHTAASSLPLLDKAKLYTMAAYTIEALLFSALKASGANATEHAIFKELARLKGYNSKIREIEERGVKGSVEGRARLDVGAAQRFIKHGLAGNKRYDLERKERIAKEKARAHLKAQQINKKFDDEGKVLESEDVTPKKRGLGEVDAQDEEDNEVLTGIEEAQPAAKKARVSVSEPMDVDSESAPSSDAASRKNKKEKKSKNSKKKEAKKAKQSAESTEADTSQQDEDATDLPVAAAPEPQPSASPSASPPPQPKKRGRPPGSGKKTPKTKSKQASDTIVVNTPEPTPSKQETRVTRNRNKRLSTQNTADEEAVVPTPDHAPKTRSETFNALLDGSIGETQKKAKASTKKGRGK